MSSTQKRPLTAAQQDVLNFILAQQRESGFPPTRREIQVAFGYTSETSVVQVIRALEKKGFIKVMPGKARGITLTTPESVSPVRPDGRPLFVDVPLRGDIQAGFSTEACPLSGITLPVHAESMGLTESSQPFALRARGTSMIGKGILDGDYIVLDAAREPHSGDVVAALLDGESTLKTLVKRGRQTFLKAENPDFGVMKPKRDLQVQGVMVGLIRGKA